MEAQEARRSEQAETEREAPEARQEAPGQVVNTVA